MTLEASRLVLKHMIWYHYCCSFYYHYHFVTMSEELMGIEQVDKMEEGLFQVACAKALRHNDELDVD